MDIVDGWRAAHDFSSSTQRVYVLLTRPCQLPLSWIGLKTGLLPHVCVECDVYTSSIVPVEEGAVAGRGKLEKMVR